MQQLADNSSQRIGYRHLRRHVIAELGTLKAAFDVERVILGGGNEPRVRPLPKYCRSQSNAATMLGAIRLWGDTNGIIAVPRGALWEIRRI
jgi:hypothetical protein